MAATLSEPTPRELRAAFESFAGAAAKLETRYAELKERAAGLEREVGRLDRLAGLSELALGIAHEIKNPLNGAMGFAALMQRTDDVVILRKHAAKVHEGLERVDRIVRELLAFTRPEGGARSATLREVLAEAAAAAHVDGGLATATAGDLELRVSAPALVRAVSNMLRNSVEAGACNVMMTARRLDDQHGELRIRDDGPGVPRSLGDRIFEPFVTTKTRGSGLGLALSARVLACLHGSLRLVGDGGPGAEFVMTFPLLAEVDHASA